MEMQQIRYFLSLAHALNFTRAAEECNVSQPALTRAIQALESELGGDLIRREGRHSHLTELGRRMLPLLQRCYDSALTARDLARAVTKNEVAPLGLALSNSVNLEMFMNPVAEVFRSVPGLQLRITHGAAAEAMKRLRDGAADLAIAGPVEDSWERLDRWPLFDEGFELALPAEHPLARENAIGLEKLKGHPVLAQSGCESRAAITDWFDARDSPFVASHEIDSFQDLKALVDACAGVAIVPASAPQSLGLKRAKLIGLTLNRTVSVYAVAGRQRSLAATAFLNLVRSADFAAAAA